MKEKSLDVRSLNHSAVTFNSKSLKVYRKVIFAKVKM